MKYVILPILSCKKKFIIKIHYLNKKSLHLQRSKIRNSRTANLPIYMNDYKYNKYMKTLKPQDILILLKLITYKDATFVIKNISSALKISQSEISESLERCKNSGLIDSTKKKVMRLALEELLVHGIKYVFPVTPGERVRGVPTAHSVSPMKELIVYNNDDILVWPHPKGTVRGSAITPLYRTVPEVVQSDEELHQLLAIVDCIRLGKRREVELATEELKKRLAYE